MKLYENIQMSMQNLKRNRFNSILIIGIIAIGISCMLFISCVGRGTQQKIENELENAGIRTLELTVDSDNIDRSDLFTFSDIRLLKNTISAIQYGSPIFKIDDGFGKENTTDIEHSVAILASDTDFSAIADCKFISGRFFSKDEFESVRSVAVLDEKAAQSIFGYTDPVGKNVEISIGSKRMKLNIVGVIETKQNSLFQDENKKGTIIIPGTTYINNSGSDGRTSICYLIIDGHVNIQKITNSIIQYLHVIHNNKEENIYHANSVSKFPNLMNEIQKNSNLLKLNSMIIMLFLNGIIIIFAMIFLIKMRTKEIGIKKAIGAKNSVIVCQFLIEIIILLVIGIFLGILLALFLLLIIKLFTDISFAFSWIDFILIPCFLCIIGVLCVLILARHILKLSPIDVLRDE